MAERDIVMVEWIDTTGQGQWQDRAYTKKELRLCQCRTFGEVLEDADAYLMIAGSVDDTHDNVNDVNSIPKSAIKQVTVLKKATPQVE